MSLMAKFRVFSEIYNFQQQIYLYHINDRIKPPSERNRECNFILHLMRGNLTKKKLFIENFKNAFNFLLLIIVIYCCPRYLTGDILTGNILQAILIH